MQTHLLHFVIVLIRRSSEIHLCWTISNLILSRCRGRITSLERYATIRRSVNRYRFIVGFWRYHGSGMSVSPTTQHRRNPAHCSQSKLVIHCEVHRRSPGGIPWRTAGANWNNISSPRSSGSGPVLIKWSNVQCSKLLRRIGKSTIQNILYHYVARWCFFFQAEISEILFNCLTQILLWSYSYLASESTCFCPYSCHH